MNWLKFLKLNSEKKFLQNVATWSNFAFRMLKRKDNFVINLPVERLYCKRPILCLASSKILTPPPHRAACVPPPPLVRGEDTLSRGRGGWGVNILEDARHSSVLYKCKYFVNLPIAWYRLLYPRRWRRRCRCAQTGICAAVKAAEAPAGTVQVRHAHGPAGTVAPAAGGGALRRRRRAGGQGSRKGGRRPPNFILQKWGS